MDIFEQVKKILCDQLDLEEEQVNEDSEVIDQLDGSLLLAQHYEQVAGVVPELFVAQQIGHSLGAELSVVDLLAQGINGGKQRCENLRIIAEGICHRINSPLTTSYT